MGRARAGSTRGGGRGSPAHTFTWQAFSEGKQGLGTFPRPPHPAPSTLPPRFSPLGCRSQPGPCHGSCVPILAREHPEPPRLDGGCPRGHREPQPLPEDAAVPPVHGGTRGLGAAPIPSRVVSALSTPAASAKLIYFLHEYGRYKTCKNKLFFPFFFVFPIPSSPSHPRSVPAIYRRRRAAQWQQLHLLLAGSLQTQPLAQLLQPAGQQEQQPGGGTRELGGVRFREWKN